MKIIAFHDDIGRIVQTQSGLMERHLGEYRARGLHFAEIDDLRATGQTHYVDAGKVVERPSLSLPISKTEIAADGEDAAVIDGLPKPCTVAVDGAPVAVDDGQLTLKSDMAAEYAIEIEHWPYRLWRRTIVAG